jgi:hypothetical protein
MHMNETIQKLKHSQYEPPQKNGDYIPIYSYKSLGQEKQRN